MNPTPCGFFPGDPKGRCTDSQNQIDNYRNRISGPLLDRIDLHIEVPALEFKEMTSKEPGEDSATIRERVLAARRIQYKRFRKDLRDAGADLTQVSLSRYCNSRMGSKAIRRHCKLDEQSMELLRNAMAYLNLSARAYDRILKVARTIADLEASEAVTEAHISEAVQYRSLDRQLWG